MSVVFSAAAPGPEPAIGTVLGLVAAVSIGIAIFAFGVRVDLRRFFQVTAVILIFVAAGPVRLRSPRVRRGGRDRQQRDHIRHFEPAARVESARCRAGGAVRLPIRTDPARGLCLLRVPHPRRRDLHLDRPAAPGDTARHGVRPSPALPLEIQGLRSLHRSRLPKCTFVGQIRARSARKCVAGTDPSGCGRTRAAPGRP